MASASNFRTSLRRNNVIYTLATFSRTKASAKWSVTAATLSSVTPCMQIRAQFRLFQVKAMFKQHANLMIWTWILRFQTASRNEFPCKNSHSFLIHISHKVNSGVFKHFKADDYAEWPLVLKRLKEGVHIKWLRVWLTSWEVLMKSYLETEITKLSDGIKVLR